MKSSKKKHRNSFFPRGSGCGKRGPMTRCDSWKRYPTKDRTVQFAIIWFIMIMIIVFGVLSSINKSNEDEQAPIKKIIERFFP